MGYLHTFLRPGHAYYPAWREYRRRRKLALLVTAAMPLVVPVGGLLVLPIALWIESEVPVMLVGATCMVVCIAMHSRWLRFPCPRCGGTFAFSFFRRSFDRCLHCGLEKYAPCDPAEQEWEYADHTVEASD